MFNQAKKQMACYCSCRVTKTKKKGIPISQTRAILFVICCIKQLHCMDGHVRARHGLVRACAPIAGGLLEPRYWHGHAD